jgi:hypothetical protein
MQLYSLRAFQQYEEYSWGPQWFGGDLNMPHTKQTNKQTTFLNSRNVYTDLVSIVLQSKNLWYMLVEKERRMEKN